VQALGDTLAFDSQEGIAFTPVDITTPDRQVLHGVYRAISVGEIRLLTTTDTAPSHALPALAEDLEGRFAHLSYPHIPMPETDYHTKTPLNLRTCRFRWESIRRARLFRLEYIDHTPTVWVAPTGTPLGGSRDGWHAEEGIREAWSDEGVRHFGDTRISHLRSYQLIALRGDSLYTIHQLPVSRELQRGLIAERFEIVSDPRHNEDPNSPDDWPFSSRGAMAGSLEGTNRNASPSGPSPATRR
jgi:hypothetical protein